MCPKVGGPDWLGWSSVQIGMLHSGELLQLDGGVLRGFAAGRAWDSKHNVTMSYYEIVGYGTAMASCSQASCFSFPY